MFSTQTLVKISLVAILAIYLHNAAKPIRDDIKQERACLESATNGIETERCFDLMEANKAKRDRQ